MEYDQKLIDVNNEENEASLFENEVDKFFMDEFYDDNDVDNEKTMLTLSESTIKPVSDENLKIIQERHESIKDLSADVLTLSELFKDFSHMVWEQDDTLNLAVENIESAGENVEQAVEHLEKAETYHSNYTSRIFEVSAIVLGTALGSVGFIGGPWIGVPTTMLGLSVGSGVAYVRKKTVG